MGPMRKQAEPATKVSDHKIYSQIHRSRPIYSSSSSMGPMRKQAEPATKVPEEGWGSRETG